MATKKARKGAVSVARKSAVPVASKKPVPKKGDVVWIDAWGGVIGICEDYDERFRLLELSWSKNTAASGIWPCQQVFSPVRAEEISILSPCEIFEKVNLLVKKRDERVMAKLSRSAKSAFCTSAIDIYQD